MELNRQFQFYDIIPIRDPQYGSVENSLFSNPQLSCICSTPSYLIFNANTTIKILNRQFEYITEFESYDLSYNLIKIHHIVQSNLIATIAEKIGSPSVLKIWDLNKIIKNKSNDNTDHHSYHSKVEISNEDNNHPITSFDANADFNLLVVGFSNGNVILIRGDIVHDRGSRQRLIYQSVADPITSCFLCNNDDTIFVTTISKILTMPTSGKTQSYLVLDKKNGAELGNASFNYQLKQLIVCNDQNIVFYNSSQKLTTLQLSYPKRQIYNLLKKNYLLVISPGGGNTNTNGNGNGNGNANIGTSTRLIILDYDSKQIIMNTTISSSVREIFEWHDELCLLSNDGLLFKLIEKPIEKQLDIIIQRNLYPIAINLAQQHNLNNVKQIHAKYADYLYDRQDYDEAMIQYLNCLDSTTETSEVIKRFKGNQNLANLIKYLYKMFQLKIANSEHITLLMCCYIKLKLKDELSSFINELNTGKDEEEDQEPGFDLETEIQLCRESNFYDIATDLAVKYQRYEMVIEIQLTDLHNYDAVLAYCNTLSVNDLLSALLSPHLNLVRVLLAAKPMDITELLIKIFTGTFHSVPFDPDILKDNTDQMAQTTTTNGTATNGTTNGRSTYLPPKPRLIFKSFIDNEMEFVVFLESCLESYEKFNGDLNDKKDLIITLFEVYVSLYNKDNNNKTELWSTKAKELVKKNESLIDMTHLLLLCQLNDFNLDDELYSETNIIDLYRSCIISQDLDKAIGLLHKYGPKEHVLFKLALQFYCSSESIYTKVSTEEFEYLFDNITTYKIFTPLEIIEIMSLNDVAKIGILKKILLQHISSIKKNINKNEKLVQSYEEENDKLTQNIHDLTTNNTNNSTIQPSRCSMCKQQLKLPIVHFKCSHSYHLNCLDDDQVDKGQTSDNDNNHTCPKCIQELDEIEMIRNQQEEMSERNDLFLNSLNNNTINTPGNDNLQIISDFIGRGSLENLKYVI